MIFRLACLAWIGQVSADNLLDLPLGATGFKILKAVGTSREQALSQSGVGSPGLDAEANPATDTASRSLLSVGWVRTYAQFDGSLQEARWVMPINPRWNFQARARYQGFEDLEGRDGFDQKTGTYSASAWALDAGFSAPTPWDGLRAGLFLGGGMNSLSNVMSFAGWATGGVRYAPANTPWALGLSVSNLGLATESGDSAESLPATLQAGGSWTFHWNRWAFVPMADVRIVADEEWTVPVGFEARWEGVSLRTGFPVGRPEAAPSFGCGYLGEAWGIDAGLGWHQALGFAPSGRITVRM